MAVKGLVGDAAFVGEADDWFATPLAMAFHGRYDSASLREPKYGALYHILRGGHGVAVRWRAFGRRVEGRRAAETGILASTEVILAHLNAFKPFSDT